MQQSLFQQDTPSTEAEDLPYWLALLRTPWVGAIQFFKLLELFPQLPELFQQSPTALSALGLKPESVSYITRPNWKVIEADLHWANGKNNHIITRNHPHYPPQLLQIPNPPPLLFVKGKPELLSLPQLAIVGSRNPSPQGLENARSFAQQIAKAGLVITSGLALGIDAAAHQGALAGLGQTIAVLGCSLDRIYPQSNSALAEQLISNGALLSEFPLGTQPRSEHFPQRNRIVSGLSLGTLVVEATVRSGSLITARLAGDQGREIFAIPGSIHNPLSRGCHLLIRQGAKLVETVADILEELPFLAQSLSPVKPPEKNFLDADHQQLLQCIGYEATSLDLIAERSGLSTAKIASMLLALELQGLVYRSVIGYVKNIKGS